MFQHIIYFGECALKEFKFYSCWEQCSVNVNQVKLVDSVVKKIIFLFLLLLGLVFCCCFKAVHILNLFIYFRLHWVFVAAHRLSLVAASRGHSSSWCLGFSLQCLLLWQSTGSRHMGFSSCGTQAQQLWFTGSRVETQQLWHVGLVAPQHMGSSRTRTRTRVPCIGRRILNHCTSREVPLLLFFFFVCLFYQLQKEECLNLQS